MQDTSNGPKIRNTILLVDSPVSESDNSIPSIAHRNTQRTDMTIQILVALATLLLTSILVGNNAVLPRRQAVDIQGFVVDCYTIQAVALPVTVLEPLQRS